jgi:L-threonylcarbamoyladenylate synthase
LIETFGRAIAAPSANLSGKPSPTCFEHVKDDMNGRVDMIIDGGDCEIGLESTIVKLNDDGTMTLLRPGKITITELACIGDVYVADAVTDKLREGEVALSPGMKYRHYAPEAPVELLDGNAEQIVEYIKCDGKNNYAVICYSDDEDLLRASLGAVDFFVLGARDNINEQAHQLFAILREVDKRSYNKVYAPLPSKDGVGLALYNRMIRAAAHTIINLRQGRNG